MKISIGKATRWLRFVKRQLFYCVLKTQTCFTSDKAAGAVRKETVPTKDKEKLRIAMLGRAETAIFEAGEAGEAGEGAADVVKNLFGADAVLYFDEDAAESHDVLPPGVYNVAASEYALLTAGNVKIGLKVFDGEAEDSLLRLRRDVLRARRALKKRGADFFIAYVRRGKNDVLIPMVVEKVAGTWGFDCVIGVNAGIRQKRSYRRVDFGETRVLYSVGELLSSSKEEENGAPSYAISYGMEIAVEDGKARLIKEGYEPLVYVAGKGLSALDASKKYSDIKKTMKGSRLWSEMLTLGEVFEVIGEKLPSKYEKLRDRSVSQICTRTFETSPGTIYFYRRQFNDPNDKKLQNEFSRLRLVLRAFLRKSFMMFSYRKLPSFVPHVVIEDPTEAHIKLMAWHREKFTDARFIGITGSIGKTSTKDMLYCALSGGARTQKNLRNTNVQVTIGLNLQRIGPDCEIYVQELGGGRPGGASRHSRMIMPDAAIVTNIGTAHIGNFSSKEDLRDNKLGVIDGLKPDGALFLNGDDELLWEAAPECRTVYYAVDNREADYYADNISVSGESTDFDIVHEGSSVHVRINVLGKHNVLNAVCSFAVARYFGLSDEVIASGLARFRTEGIRQNVIKVGGLTLFMDCYNASAESVETSFSVLDTLRAKEGAKKVAVIGDVTGMGDSQEQIDERVAEIIDGNKMDVLVCYGNEAEKVAAGVKNHTSDKILCFNEEEKLEEWLKKGVADGDVVMFKGSSKMKLDEVVDDVYGLNTCDQRYIDEKHCYSMKKKDMVFNMFEDYASLKRFYGNSETVKVPGRVAGKKIKKIYRKAFFGNARIKNVETGKNTVHIASECFAGCPHLEEAILSSSVRYVGKKAFSNCKSLKRVEIEGDLFFLGSGAFENCRALREIVIPPGLDPKIEKRLRSMHRGDEKIKITVRG